MTPKSAAVLAKATLLTKDLTGRAITHLRNLGNIPTDGLWSNYSAYFCDGVREENARLLPLIHSLLEANERLSVGLHALYTVSREVATDIFDDSNCESTLANTFMSEIIEGEKAITANDALMDGLGK